MSARGRRPAAAQVGLSKERVVQEAVRLADQDGVHGLSMRRLAGELGAAAMSLYHYVASKEELLDAMIDVVFAEIELPRTDAGADADGHSGAAGTKAGCTDGADWQAAMRRRALSARAVLARHPWALGLMESRTSPGRANLRHHEAVIACLRRAGFSVVMATHANWLLDSYVYGFALQESGLPFDTTDELAGMVEQVYLPQLPADEFPYLRESATELAAAGYVPADEFGFGLDLILAALESLRTAGEPTSALA